MAYIKKGMQDKNFQHKSDYEIQDLDGNHDPIGVSKKVRLLGDFGTAANPGAEAITGDNMEDMEDALVEATDSQNGKWQFIYERDFGEGQGVYGSQLGDWDEILIEGMSTNNFAGSVGGHVIWYPHIGTRAMFITYTTNSGQTTRRSFWFNETKSSTNYSIPEGAGSDGLRAIAFYGRNIKNI